MKKTNPESVQLSLIRHTIRVLDTAQLVRIAGGASTDYRCLTTTCQRTR